MKQAELTKQIMRRVVSLEKRRIAVWLAGMGIAVVVLGGMAAINIGRSWTKIRESGTGDLLQIFGEDGEVVYEFGPEVAKTIWWELPKVEIAVGMIAMAAVVGLWLATRNKQKTIGQKLHHVIDFEKNNEKGNRSYRNNRNSSGGSGSCGEAERKPGGE
jgi:hypothetical protein